MCTIHVQASFLTDDPVAYFKVGKSNVSTTYINFWQTSVLRYDPPFYIIQGNIITESYEYGNIVSITYNFMYDYNRQIVFGKPVLATYYDAYGNILNTMSLTNDSLVKISKNTSGGVAADMYFLANYHMPFYKQDSKV
jgi:hypothetical protein